MPNPAQDPELTASELEVLKVLWDEGPSTVREVLEALHAKGRELAYTTVLTFLSRLEQKRCVRSDKSGVAYIYTAKLERQAVTTARVGTLVEQLFDGATGELVLQLVRNERLSGDEIAELQQLINAMADGSGKGRRKR